MHNSHRGTSGSAVTQEQRPQMASDSGHVTSPSALSDDSCPDLGKYCPLHCPMGYERDDFGCEVCECSIPAPKCRPLTCSKTCPYGYV